MPDHLDILAIGEPMLEFNQTRGRADGAYLPGQYLQGFGGDTSNTAIAAARQGAKVGYFTALGDDAFGREFLSLWDREEIDRSAVLIQPGQSTGIYFVTHGANGHEFSYYRVGSAASRLGPRDLPDGLVERSKILHVSGISQAISTTACDLVFDAIARARNAGRKISYDTNLRLRLWPLDRARAVIHAAVGMSHIALPGLDDAQQLTALQTPEAICDFYLHLGVEIVALTLGKEGTMVATRHEKRHIPSRVVAAVDATGAGDTFDGAFLAEFLKSGDPFSAAHYANAAAALSTQGYGAVAPIPRRPQVEVFMKA